MRLLHGREGRRHSSPFSGSYFLHPKVRTDPELEDSELRPSDSAVRWLDAAARLGPADARKPPVSPKERLPAPPTPDCSVMGNPLHAFLPLSQRSNSLIPTQPVNTIKPAPEAQHPSARPPPSRRPSTPTAAEAHSLSSVDDLGLTVFNAIDGPAPTMLRSDARHPVNAIPPPQPNV
jgi:hypothetical protein